jgi:hypothetical protein
MVLCGDCRVELDRRHVMLFKARLQSREHPRFGQCFPQKG